MEKKSCRWYRESLRLLSRTREMTFEFINDTEDMELNNFGWTFSQLIGALEAEFIAVAHYRRTNCKYRHKCDKNHCIKENQE